MRPPGILVHKQQLGALLHQAPESSEAALLGGGGQLLDDAALLGWAFNTNLVEGSKGILYNSCVRVDVLPNSTRIWYRLVDQIHYFLKEQHMEIQWLLFTGRWIQMNTYLKQGLWLPDQRPLGSHTQHALLQAQDTCRRTGNQIVGSNKAPLFYFFFFPRFLLLTVPAKQPLQAGVKGGPK